MNDIICIKRKYESINAEINLPLSKSESNRLLMIYSLMDKDINSLSISDADDSVMLRKYLNFILENENNGSDITANIDCGNAGTVMRFLCAFLAFKNMNYILTGSDRMKNRPIGPLVEALNKLGANIEYVEEQGFPPLLIKKSSFNTDINRISIDVSKSSQFASALLMCLPLLENDVNIDLTGGISSWPYIELTLELMRYYGIEYEFCEGEISLKGKYVVPQNEKAIEADWSSASYWYQMLAMIGKGEILLKALDMNSFQGDRALVNIFSKLGVQSYQMTEGVLIQAKGEILMSQNIDFSDIPDLAPAVINCCAAMNVTGKFTGLETLNLKESRRMDVLIAGLEKMGYDLRDVGMGEYILISSCNKNVLEKDFSEIVINTENDHRMAMAFAPFAIVGDSIGINYSGSVKKSYPNFWEEMKKEFEIIE